jgi:signal transduction histidine kinase
MTDTLGNSADARPTWKQHLSGIQWRWVLLTGVATPIVATGLVMLMITAYAARMSIAGSVDDTQVERFIVLTVPWLAPLIGIMITVGAASWTAHRAGSKPVLHGALVGLVVAIAGQAVGLVFSTGPNLLDLLSSLLVIGAGCMGGRLTRAALAQQEILYQISQAIGTASDPQAIVIAIGEHLDEPNVSHVALWQVVAQDRDKASIEIALSNTWSPQGVQSWPPGLRLDTDQVPSLAQLWQETPVLVRAREFTPPERAIWERLDVASVILLPLITSDGAWTGVLMIASRFASGVSRSKAHAYQTLGTQAALALENMRLVEQVRQAAVLEERQRLAREIHDTLAQGFTSIVMHLEAAEQGLPDEPETIQRHLDEARHTARDGLEQARRLVWALRPAHLERASLPEALARVAARWSEGTGIEAHVTTTGSVSPLPPEIEVTLLRALQEALTNIRKHAQASRVAVTLSYMDDLVVLDVQDDGTGFDPTQTPSAAQPVDGFGLTAMHERVQQMGGSLLVESAPGEGTTLAIEIPTSRRT